jgi:hypothetical protein
MSNENKTSGSGGVRSNTNNRTNNRKKNNYYRNKNYNKNGGAQNKTTEKKEPLPPRIKPKTYTPKKKQMDTFTELQYADKVIFVLGGVTLLMSIFMWFMGYREEATYLGIWVPGIFSAGTFIRLSFTRAKRK